MVLTERGASYMIHEHTPSVTIQDANTNFWFPVELAVVVGVNRTQIMRLTLLGIEVKLGLRGG
jgi:hypothetical protein